jgi:imidazole glycerol phosphate synthase glutamine amidotransferase subunit
MITILDYGAGNLRSVENTLAVLGTSYQVTRDPLTLLSATKVILPGVGHFGQMMRSLDRMNIREPLLELIRNGVPFLGICLGLQALFESSEEAPDQRGLAIFPGAIRRFPALARVPHMGWNQIEPVQESKLLGNLAAQPHLYFAHSYYAPITTATTAVCNYSVPYTAILESNNIYGVQFHPEKSGPLGLAIIKNFIEQCSSSRADIPVR